MRCAEIRELLPALEDDTDTGLTVRRHLSSCAACRAELVMYQQMAEGLRHLRSSVTDVPPELSRALIAIPTDQGAVASLRTHVSRNRRAYVGGAALAAGALGATLWKLRTRRVATA